MVGAQDPKLEPRPNEVIVFTLRVPAIFMLGVTSGVISKGGGLLLVAQFYSN